MISKLVLVYVAYNDFSSVPFGNHSIINISSACYTHSIIANAAVHELSQSKQTWLSCSCFLYLHHQDSISSFLRRLHPCRPWTWTSAWSPGSGWASAIRWSATGASGGPPGWLSGLTWRGSPSQTGDRTSPGRAGSWPSCRSRRLSCWNCRHRLKETKTKV